MGGLELLLKPLRFVENEFESIVNGLYNSYNRITGKSQHSLSKIYAAGATIYVIGYSALQDPVNSYRIGASIGYVYFLWFFCRKTNEVEQLEKALLENEETTKNNVVEDWKKDTKSLGRFFLSLGAIKALLEVIEYFQTFNTGRPILEFSDVLNIEYLILYALTGYTAAIDTNNPKKSKVMEAARNGLSYLTARIPQKVAVKIPIRYDSINIDTNAQSLPLPIYPPLS